MPVRMTRPLSSVHRRHVCVCRLEGSFVRHCGYSLLASRPTDSQSRFPIHSPRSSRLLEAQTVKICRGSSGLMSRLASKRKSRSGRPPLSELNWLLRPASFDLYYHDRLMGVIPWTDGVLYSTYCTLSASKERYQMLLSQWSIC